MSADRERLIVEWFRLWIGPIGYFCKEFQDKEQKLLSQIHFTSEEHGVLMCAVRAVSEQQLEDRHKELAS